ncbi:MAG: ABC transporter substrate-binding protein [Ilumatobacteraceae bacterium]
MVRKNRTRAALLVAAVFITACGESSNSGTADEGSADAAASDASTAGSASTGTVGAVNGTISTKDSLTVVAPDTGWTWTIDSGFGGLEPALQLAATLIKKPYIPSSASDALQQDVNNYEPYLAESWEVSEDGLVYTFHLSDAISAAGNELTADDVLWSFERRFATPTSVSPSVQAPQITRLEQFQKVDDKTVTLTLDQAGHGATALALLADLTAWIYDSTLLEEHVTPEDPYAVTWSRDNPNFGFGPYEVTDFQPGTSVTLAAREDFVLGAPLIKTVVVKVVPDAGTRANLLRSGDADMAVALVPADLVALEAEEATKVATVDNPNAYIMMPLVTNKPPFDDMLVRQAFAYAIPYEEIIENVYHGLAVRNGPGFVRRDHPGYDGSGLTPFTFDPAKAQELLAEAGVTDGVSFDLAVSAAEPDMQEAAIQIQTFAKEAGFDVHITQLPAAAFGSGRVDHSFQAFILKDYAITLTPSYELNVYTAPGGSNNLADWENDAFYAARAEGDELADPYTPEAGALWNEAERYFINEAPIPMIAQIQPTVAMSEDLMGYAWRSDNYLDFSELYFK